MPDCERLQLLSIICQTTHDEQKGIQISEQTKQYKTKASNSFQNNAHTNNKIRQEIELFLPRQS